MTRRFRAETLLSQPTNLARCEGFSSQRPAAELDGRAPHGRQLRGCHSSPVSRVDRPVPAQPGDGWAGQSRLQRDGVSLAAAVRGAGRSIWHPIHRPRPVLDGTYVRAGRVRDQLSAPGRAGMRLGAWLRSLPPDGRPRRPCPAARMEAQLRHVHLRHGRHRRGRGWSAHRHPPFRGFRDPRHRFPRHPRADHRRVPLVAHARKRGRASPGLRVRMRLAGRFRYSHSQL